MTTRILIVDDHPVVRSGLRGVLSGQSDLEVVAEAGSGEDALAQVLAASPDVVLCDLRLGPGMDGVALTRQLRASPGPYKPAVVILTTYDHDVDIMRAVEAGAAGYLLKDASTAEIVAAITRAARGETVLSDRMSQRVVAAMRSQRADLSPREVQVIGLVSAGLSNRDIAKKLFLSEATVKTHLNHAFGKLGADSRTSAVATARAAGLID